MISPPSDKSHSPTERGSSLNRFQFTKFNKDQSKDNTDTGLISPVSPPNSESNLENMASHLKGLSLSQTEESSNNYDENCSVSPGQGKTADSKRKNSFGSCANVDQSSMSSEDSNGSGSINLRSRDSLIFERFVQDPMVDAQPVPSSLPRHFTSENYVPPALDAATGLITGCEPDKDINLEEFEFSVPSRRSSTANLEAAFANGNASRSRIPSRRQTQSNLTQQLRSDNKPLLRPSLNQSITAPQPTLSSFGRAESIHKNSGTNSSRVQRRPEQQRSVFPPSPLLRENKSTSSFFSYADMINQEDQESTFPIRRPSISLSFSGHRMGRSSSVVSSCSGMTSPRSPTFARGPRSPVFPKTRRDSGINFSSTFAHARNSHNSKEQPSDADDVDLLTINAPPTEATRTLIGLSRKNSGFSRSNRCFGNGRRGLVAGRSPSISSNLSSRSGHRGEIICSNDLTPLSTKSTNDSSN